MPGEKPVLKLLLDEHVPPLLAGELARHRPGTAVIALQDFAGRAFLGAYDEKILLAGAEGGWTLLTYDQKTIPPLLMAWGEQGKAHGGIIFVDRKTLEPAAVGGLLRALLKVWETLGEIDWTDRVVYLSR